MLQRCLLMTRSVRKNWPDVAIVALIVGWVFCILRGPRSALCLPSIAFFLLVLAVAAANPERLRTSPQVESDEMFATFISRSKCVV
jgi:hypothetical protein